ncbi:hypothetical protein ACFFX0_04675 [Citricoccus parietis]|uniref:Uncharacterized protein n=1 Tax=Citricoccus parietis TaxID=592307 RepID=A0ABV5FV09_9MICC
MASQGPNRPHAQSGRLPVGDAAAGFQEGRRGRAVVLDRLAVRSVLLRGGHHGPQCGIDATYVTRAGHGAFLSVMQKSGCRAGTAGRHPDTCMKNAGMLGAIT